MKFTPVFLLAAVLIGQTPPPPTPSPVGGTTSAPKPTADSKPASLSGRVVDSKTGQPIRKASLTLRPLASFTGPGPYTPPSPSLTTTDSEGNYHYEALEPGAYTLQAEHPGHVRQSYGARKPGGPGTRLRLKAGETLEHADIPMLQQSIITGRVLDAEGDPVPNTSIRIYRSGFDRGQRTWLPVGGSNVDETGAFRCAGLAPGRYLLQATVTNRSQMYGEVPPVNRTGEPEEALVTTYYPSAVDRADAEPIAVGPSQELVGLNVKIQKVTVYRIQGALPGAPPADARVRVSLRAKGEGAFGSFVDNSMQVKPDGTFEFDKVQPGSYTLSAFASQGALQLLGKTDVEVSRENVRGLRLTTVDPFTLTGLIHLDISPRQYQDAQGQPPKLESIHVNLFPTDGGYSPSEPSTVKEDGSLTIPRVTPDRYTVNLYGQPPNTYVKEIRFGAADALNQPLDLTAGGSATSLDVTLALGTAVVTGTVADAEGKPVSGAIISLVPDPWQIHRLDLNRTTNASPDGRFALPNLPPGPYKICAFTEAEFGSQFDPDILKSVASYAQAITLKPGSRQTVTLKAVPAEDPKL